MPVAVTERATELGIKVFRSYGSTEHPSITGCSLDEPEVKRLTTDGRAAAGRRDAARRRRRDPRAAGPTAASATPIPTLTAAVFDDDGWYHTGDVGVLDDDGYLTITDRMSDIIIRGGENISAQEVEELLLGLDAVAEVSVVAAPDERLGEQAAAVVPRARRARRRRRSTTVRGHLADGRPGPAEVARVAPRRRRLPPHRVGQGAEVQASPAAARRTARELRRTRAVASVQGPT